MNPTITLARGSLDAADIQAFMDRQGERWVHNHAPVMLDSHALACSASCCRMGLGARGSSVTMEWLIMLWPLPAGYGIYGQTCECRPCACMVWHGCSHEWSEVG